MRPWRVVLALLVLAALAACSSGPRKGGSAGGGGYYKDDGPDANPPPHLDRVPDAVPRIEPLASGANRPYVVLGRRYVPDTSGQPYRQRGIASWYGRKFHGNRTSNGETYDMYAMTAAHKTLPLPSYVRVTRVSDGRSVVLRVNDRGPFHDGRIIDLSYVAAHKLGIVGQGSAEVVVERIMPDEIRNWQPAPDAAPLVAEAASAGTASDYGGGPLAAGGAAAAALPVAAPEPIAMRPVPAAPAQQPASPAGPATASAQTASGAPPSGAMTQATTQPPVAAATAPGVFLQLGAFSQPGNAQSLAARVSPQLTSQGQPGVSVRQAANSLYRVLVGPYLTREAALSAVQTINAYTGITPSISAP